MKPRALNWLALERPNLDQNGTGFVGTMSDEEAGAGLLEVAGETHPSETLPAVRFSI